MFYSHEVFQIQYVFYTYKISQFRLATWVITIVGSGGHIGQHIHRSLVLFLQILSLTFLEISNLIMPNYKFGR